MTITIACSQYGILVATFLSTTASVTAGCCSGTGGDVLVPASTFEACTGSWQLLTCGYGESCISYECYTSVTMVGPVGLQSRTQGCLTAQSLETALGIGKYFCMPTGSQSTGSNGNSQNSASPYPADPSYSPPTVPSNDPGDSNTSSSESPSLATIIGSTLGGVGVFALLLGFCFCRNSRRGSTHEVIEPIAAIVLVTACSFAAAAAASAYHALCCGRCKALGTVTPGAVGGWVPYICCCCCCCCSCCVCIDPAAAAK